MLGTTIVPEQNPRNNAEYTEEFDVAGDGFTPLLGAEAAQKINLVAVQHQNILHPRQETSESPDLVDVHSVNRFTEARVLAEYTGLLKAWERWGANYI